MSERLLERVRSEVRALVPYKVAHGSPGAIRLDANESPWPLPATARARISEVVGALPYHRYPDIEASALRGALAQRLQASPDELLIGVGSDEVIQVLCTAFATLGSTMLVPDPTFSMFAASAALAGMRPVRVPLGPRFELDLPRMLEAIERDRPALIFLATPNNPTGNTHPDASLEEIVHAAPDALVVIDEAYAPFARPRRSDWIARFPNVGVMGTLSKIGLAALRLGWIRVRPELARELDKVRLPYDLPTPSQAIGALMLTELHGVLEEQIASIRAEREQLGEALSGRVILGAPLLVHPSEANFFLVEHPHAQTVATLLASSGIVVRAFSGHARLAQHLRITVGTPAENAALLESLDAARDSGS